MGLYGFEVTTPRDTLKQAFQAEWIDDENLWLQMLKDRNQTSHVYDENLAKTIYEHIKAYYPVLQKTVEVLRELLNRVNR